MVKPASGWENVAAVRNQIKLKLADPGLNSLPRLMIETRFVFLDTLSVSRSLDNATEYHYRRRRGEIAWRPFFDRKFFVDFRQEIHANLTV